MIVIYQTLLLVCRTMKPRQSSINITGSRLEKYLAVLQILSDTHHPLKFTEIERATNLDSTQLENALSFLLEYKAIGKKPYGSSQAFFVAPLGAKLVLYFKRAGIFHYV